MTADENVLSGKATREKKGSETFDKYLYQYDWAIFRLIKEHEKGGEDYAIFVEEHEDVTVASSTKSDAATFEIYQVKCLKSPLNINAMTRVEKDSNASIIGRLGQTLDYVPKPELVSEIGVVCSPGFNISLTHGLKLEKIRKADLRKEDVEKLEEALKSAVGHADAVEIIAFSISEVPEKGHKEFVKGVISELLETVSMGRRCNPGAFYRVLAESFHKKGSSRFDYSNWDELLDKKAVSKADIDGLIEATADTVNSERLIADLERVLGADLGYETFKMIRMRNHFSRYMMASIQSGSMYSECASEISEVISMINMNGLFTSQVIGAVMSAVSEKVKAIAINGEELEAWVLYELLKR